MHIALVIGHTGKPDRPTDRGAAYTHPSGVRLSEVSLVRRYADALDVALLAAGHRCVTYEDGTYDERARRAKISGASCLLALHANAGLAGRPGQRGELFYWPGSVKGQALAEAIAETLGHVVPYTVRVIPAEVGPYLDASRVAAVRSTIDGAVSPSVCVEPFFLDGEGADELVSDDYLTAIGKALAAGVIAWRG